MTVLNRYGHLYEDSDTVLTERLDAVYLVAAAGPARGYGGTGLASVSPIGHRIGD